MPGSDMNCADSWPCTSRWCTHELPSWSSSSQVYRGRSHHRARLCSAHTRGGKTMSSIDTVKRGLVSSMTTTTKWRQRVCQRSAAAVIWESICLIYPFAAPCMQQLPSRPVATGRSTRRSVGVTDMLNRTVVRERVASSFLSSGQAHGAIYFAKVRTGRQAVESGKAPREARPYLGTACTEPEVNVPLKMLVRARGLA